MSAAPARRRAIAWPRHRRLGRPRRRRALPAPRVVRGLDQPRRAEHERVHGHVEHAARQPRDPERGGQPRGRRALRERRRAGRGRGAAAGGLQGPLRRRRPRACARRRTRSSTARSSSRVFQDLFRIAVDESHTTLVQVLEGGGDRVSTDEGEVTLDLREIIVEAADRIGIGEQVVGSDPGRRRADRGAPLGRARHGAERRSSS